MARKFAVDRALYLYQQHELMRIREKLTTINVEETPLKEELQSGKFTVLSTRDNHGAALALFNAHLHDPAKAMHRTTLQNVVYQLDVALENPLTQRYSTCTLWGKVLLLRSQRFQESLNEG